MTLHMKENVDINRVVITGLGVVSSLGSSAHDFWVSLLKGKSGVKIVTDIDLSQCRSQIFAQVSGFDANAHFSRKELLRLSSSSQFAIVAATEAVEDANMQLGQIDPENVGVIIGSSIGGFSASEPRFRRLFEDDIASPFTIPVVMNNAPASNVSIRFGFQGPLMNIDAACASSTHAVGYAFNQIRFGQAKIMLAGGADSPFSESIIKSWASMRALSERNDFPKGACRPFSLDRDGIVLGEGAGILVLESESSAIQRQATIYAELSGYGATSDSLHLTRPDVHGPSRAMRIALSNAKLDLNKIDYINAHATATLWNDKIETQAIKEVFGSTAYDVPIVGIKAATGHTIAASGALELISCILSIRDDLIPPTINMKIPDPDCDLDYVTEGQREYKVDHAMSNSFAFGGSNAVLIVSRYTP